MGFIELYGLTYEKLMSLNIGKYEYLLVLKDGEVFYFKEAGNAYEITNPDLTLEGNANTSLSDLNSRIIMNHIKELLNNIHDKNALLDIIIKIQRILENNDLFTLIKGNMNELINFNEEVDKIIIKFDSLYKDIIKKEEVKKVDIPKIKIKEKGINESANIDTFMVALLVNIGILLLIMLVLNIIK